MGYTDTTMRDTRPETELLLCCASVCVDSERAGRIVTLAQEDMDWSYLIWQASQHRIMPLLYWHLNALCPEVVPKDAMAHLRERFNNNARRNLLLTGELLKVLELFSTHGIPAIPYKGPILAASVYGNLALRQAGDLDIMVNKRDVPKVRELLVSQGYQPDHQLTRGQETALPHSQYAFHRNDNRTSLEIHWQFAPRYFAFAMDLQQLWSRLMPVSLGGKEINTLSPEDLLMILCVHGGKHIWEQLRWICDIAELIRIHRAMDWERVIQQASCLGCGRALLLGLLLANDLLGVTLPESVLSGIQINSVVRSLVAQARVSLFSKPGSKCDAIAKAQSSKCDAIAKAQSSKCDAIAKAQNMLFRGVVFHLRMMERSWDRAMYCLYRMAPVVNDRALVSLPRLFSFVYYLLRPIRLLRDYRLMPFFHLWK